MELRNAGVRMPIGKFKGTLVTLMPAPYMLWFLSVDNLRLTYPVQARAMLLTLHARLEQWPGSLARELFPPDLHDASDLL